MVGGSAQEEQEVQDEESSGSDDRLAVPVGGDEETVVEEDHAVAEPHPALFGVVGDHVSSPAVGTLGRGTDPVFMHLGFPPGGGGCLPTVRLYRLLGHAKHAHWRNLVNSGITRRVHRTTRTGAPGTAVSCRHLCRPRPRGRQANHHSSHHVSAHRRTPLGQVPGVPSWWTLVPGKRAPGGTVIR